MAPGEPAQEPARPGEGSAGEAPLPGEIHRVTDLDRLQVRHNYWALVFSQAAATGYLTLRSGFLGALFEPVAPSVFAITFAVTAHRWLYPLAAPLLGRYSDKSTREGGRRKPFMVAGLAVMGGASILLGVGPRSYWGMVVLVVLASLGWTCYRIPRFSATPDLFGQSMWAGMAVSLAVAGFLPGLVVQGVINRTWERNPATAFVVAGAFALAAGLVILVRLREPSRDLMAVASEASQMTLGERMRYIVSHKNLLVLLAAGGCISVAASPVAPLYVVYAGHVLGVGVTTVAAAGIYGGLAALPLIPLVALVSARIDRKFVGMGCAVLGTALAIGAYKATSIVTLTAYGVVASLIGVAISVSLGTLLLVLFPREVLAEVAGIWTALTTLASIAVSYGVSALIEISGDWRLLWLPLVMGSPGALVCLAFLDLPKRYRRPDLSKLRSSVRTSLMAGVRGYGPPGGGSYQRPDESE